MTTQRYEESERRSVSVAADKVTFALVFAIGLVVKLDDRRHPGRECLSVTVGDV